MKVLIVEDEVLIAMHLAARDRVGHEVCATALSAAEAMARAAAYRPDVALMDVRLAYGGSGIDAAGELLRLHGVRCIFLSANLDETTRTAVLVHDPVDFVDKPILPILLQRALEKAEGPLRTSTMP